MLQLLLYLHRETLLDCGLRWKEQGGVVTPTVVVVGKDKDDVVDADDAVLSRVTEQPLAVLRALLPNDAKGVLLLYDAEGDALVCASLDAEGDADAVVQYYVVEDRGHVVPTTRLNVPLA
jgi:hypothetical protein